MTPRMTPTQTRDTLNQIIHLAARLATLEPTIRTRAHHSAPDGYPTQSPGTNPGHQHPPGDPVGATATQRLDHPHHNPLAQAHTTILGHLHAARRLLEAAESTAQQALPPTTPPKHLDDGCVSCARIKTWSPISRTRRCRFCSSWATNHHGDEPPIPILRAHHSGRRITTRLVESITRRPGAT